MFDRFLYIPLIVSKITPSVVYYWINVWTQIVGKKFIFFFVKFLPVTHIPFQAVQRQLLQENNNLNELKSSNINVNRNYVFSMQCILLEEIRISKINKKYVYQVNIK